MAKAAAVTILLAGVVSHFQLATCFRTTPPQRTLARMFSALAVQMKGPGSLLWACEVLLCGGNELRQGAEHAAADGLSVSSRNQRSTKSSHEPEVGVKCK